MEKEARGGWRGGGEPGVPVKDRTGHVRRPTRGHYELGRPSQVLRRHWAGPTANTQVCDTFMRKSSAERRQTWGMVKAAAKPSVPSSGQDNAWSRAHNTSHTRHRLLLSIWKRRWSRLSHVTIKTFSPRARRQACTRAQACLCTQTGTTTESVTRRLLASYNGTLLQLRVHGYSLWKRKWEQTRRRRPKHQQGPEKETETTTELHSDCWDIWHRAKRKVSSSRLCFDKYK